MFGIRITKELELEGSPAEFFKVVTDVPRWYLWSTIFFHATIEGLFEEGVRGLAIPKLYRSAPFVISKIVKDRLIEIDYLIPMSKINVQYEFTPASNGKTMMRLTARNSSFYGWILYFVRGKAFRRDFEKSIGALGKQVLSLRLSK